MREANPLLEEAVSGILQWLSTKSLLVEPGSVGDRWNNWDRKSNATSLWQVNGTFNRLCSNVVVSQLWVSE